MCIPYNVVAHLLLLQSKSSIYFHSFKLYSEHDVDRRKRNVRLKSTIFSNGKSMNIRTKYIWIMYFLEIEFLRTLTFTCQNEQPACENNQEKKRIVHSKCFGVRFTLVWHSPVWHSFYWTAIEQEDCKFRLFWPSSIQLLLKSWKSLSVILDFRFAFVFDCYSCVCVVRFYFGCLCRIVIAYWNRKWNTNTHTYNHILNF